MTNQSLPARRGPRPGVWVPAGSAAAALLATLAVAWIALSSDAELPNEPGMRRSITLLAAGHGLHLTPEYSPFSIPQIALGALLQLVHPGARTLRLATVPFLILLFLATCALARRLGATRVPAAVAAAAVTTSPITLALATGLMSDVPYTALLTAGAVCLHDMVFEGRRRGWFVLLGGLATLQRQYGAMLAPVALLGLFIIRRRRHVSARDWATVGLASAVDFVAAAGPAALHLGAYDSGALGATLSHDLPARAFAGTLDLLPMMGLLGLAIVPLALATRPRSPTWLALPALVLFIGGAVLAAAFMLQGAMVLPGDWVTPYGLTPIHLGGAKPALMPVATILPAEILLIAAGGVFLAVHSQSWARSLRLPAHFLVLVLAASQMPAVFQDVVIDRHYLPTLVLVLASFAGSLQPLPPGRVLALAEVAVAAILTLQVGAYVVAEQDALAWRSAVDSLDPLAIALCPRVVAPFGESAIAHRLAFTGADDPAPGIVYHSVRPGKVVIHCRPEQPR